MAKPGYKRSSPVVSEVTPGQAAAARRSVAERPWHIRGEPYLSIEMCLQAGAARGDLVTRLGRPLDPLTPVVVPPGPQPAKWRP